MDYRTIVIGGAGNFGARIVRALRADSAIELLIAGRRPASVAGAEDVRSVILDMEAQGFASELRALSPQLVIHCAGPFQAQDYRVARAALAAGAHYLDLADGRQFVCEFAPQMSESAVAARRVAISGASTLPALSSAVVEKLMEGLASLQSIEVIIAPGQRASRGQATLTGVLSYVGRDLPVWRQGRWRRVWGWMDLREAHLDIGARLAAACDVPDLTLFPTRFPGVESVDFHAALEFRAQHWALWFLAGLRRVGLPLPVSRWAVSLNRRAGVFDAAAGDKGGMSVSIVGTTAGARRVRRSWQLTAPAEQGPEIPSMPAILLARRLARGDAPTPGAYPCMGFLTLAAFDPEFARWGITTRIEETVLRCRV